MYEIVRHVIRKQVTEVNQWQSIISGGWEVFLKGIISSRALRAIRKKQRRSKSNTKNKEAFTWYYSPLSPGLKAEGRINYRLIEIESE